MSVFKYVLLVFVCTVTFACAAQKQYRTHTVKENENIWNIAEQYGLKKADIVALNPNVKDKPAINTVLVLPATTKPAVTENDPIRFENHKVRRKETLFGIAKEYNISVDDLKRYNKELYARPLKKGDKLNIPVFATPEVVRIVTSENEKPVVVPTIEPIPVSDLSQLTSHTVQKKETRYGIAHMYGITISELEKINPQLGSEGLPEGSIINVPAITVMQTAVPEEGFMFYEVQPKEGFFRLKVNTGLTQEEILALNPHAKDGLKEGMILKMPKGGNEQVKDETVSVNLENNITNYTPKKIALLLPFRLQNAVVDSLNTKEDILKKDKLMALSLDFYSGVLMATEFAKDQGISTRLDVLDTEYSVAKTERLINGRDFEIYDAVIGPLGQKNVEKTAALLKNSDVPVFSPLSNKEIKISKNLFQTLPNDAMLEKAMIDYIKTHSSNKNIIVIADAKRSAQKAKLMQEFPDAKTAKPREEGFLYVQDIVNKLDKAKENWVILESADPVLVSNVVGVLNGLPAENKIRLFSLDKNDAYDYHDVSNTHLAKLNFTFPSVNKNYNYKDREPFLISYKNKYGVLPNKYAVRGFDLAYDVLLRLANADNIFEASEANFETEYIENKFRYSKKFLSGYVNNAFYIIKYKNDLQFEVIKD